MVYSELQKTINDKNLKDKKFEQKTSIQDENKTRHAITVGRAPEEVYLFWRNFENFPRFMKDIKSVKTISPKLSRWKAELKLGPNLEWDAEVTEIIPNKKIAWASLAGSDVQTKGIVTFEKAPGDRGTIVRLSTDYTLPGGKITEWAAFFTGEDPDTLMLINLKRMKQVLETGEYATTEGQPSGREEQSPQQH
ncbi:MAG: SRPBCC family protein [Bdellovibrionales bacterium]